MGIFWFRRALILLITWLGVLTLSFWMIHLSPGKVGGAGFEMNPKISKQSIEQMEKIYGLSDPLPNQYGRWIKRVLCLDLGTSLVDGRAVWDKILDAMPVTLWVNGGAFVIVCVLSILLGVWSSTHQGHPVEKSLSGGIFILFMVPSFWMALLFIWIFGVEWRVLPVSGLYSIQFEEMNDWEKWLDRIRHVLLPMATMILASMYGMYRFVRDHLIEILNENYIRFAYSKGMSQSRVMFRHALPNLFLPMLTLLGLSIPHILGGSVLFESLFSLPGMGRLFFDAVVMRDYPVIMGLVVVGAFFTCLGNALADCLTPLSDPRTHRANP